MMRTDKQEAVSLSKMLDGIWRMGDKDECSIKHIYWSLAALLLNQTWKDVLDYETPWDDDDEITEFVLEKRMNDLNEKWKTITDKRDEWGIKRFMEIVKISKFAFAEQYMEYFDEEE